MTKRSKPFEQKRSWAKSELGAWLFVGSMIAAGCRSSSERPATHETASNTPAASTGNTTRKAPTENAPPAPDAREARAASAIRDLEGKLKRALGQALPQGISNAIAVCQREAPAIAKEIATSTGIAVGRTSSRLRNANHAPATWAKPLLAAFEADARGTWPAHRTAVLPDGALGYAEPITVQGPCLLCHGEAISSEVAATLAERYPNDRARGYRTGDLRGIFWAVVPPAGHGATD